MRGFVFYPLVAIAAALAIGASFGFALIPITPAPQNATHDKHGYWFGPAQLAHIAQGDKQIVNVTRAWNGEIRSVQLATRRTAGAAAPTQSGARLIMAPATAQQLRGRRLDVRVIYHQFYQNSAPFLSLSLQGARGAAWLVQPTAAEDGVLRYSFTAPANLTAIGFWPTPQTDNQYYDYYGLELAGVRIQPES